LAKAKMEKKNSKNMKRGGFSFLSCT